MSSLAPSSSSFSLSLTTHIYQFSSPIRIAKFSRKWFPFVFAAISVIWLFPPWINNAVYYLGSSFRLASNSPSIFSQKERAKANIWSAALPWDRERTFHNPKFTQLVSHPASCPDTSPLTYTLLTLYGSNCTVSSSNYRFCLKGSASGILYYLSNFPSFPPLPSAKYSLSFKTQWLSSNAHFLGTFLRALLPSIAKLDTFLLSFNTSHPRHFSLSFHLAYQLIRFLIHQTLQPLRAEILSYLPLNAQCLAQ